MSKLDALENDVASRAGVVASAVVAVAGTVFGMRGIRGVAFGWDNGCIPKVTVYLSWWRLLFWSSVSHRVREMILPYGVGRVDWSIRVPPEGVGSS